MFNIPMPGAKAEKVKRVCDPRRAAAARELRDRWLEKVNERPLLDAAKYDVTRAISEEGRVGVEVVKRLAAA